MAPQSHFDKKTTPMGSNVIDNEVNARSNYVIDHYVGNNQAFYDLLLKKDPI